MTDPHPVVLKFGGTALEDPASVVRRIRSELVAGTPVVVVASARAGVTDLLAAALASPRDPAVHRSVLARLESMHPGLPGTSRALLGRLRRLLRQVGRAYPADRPMGDRVLSHGERLAAAWLAGRLRDAGVPAVAVEADHLGLLTDNVYGAASIRLAESQAPVRRGLRRVLRSGRVPVVTGYFGRSLEGRVAVLGRGGSDYSATAVGAILGARKVELVKGDVSVYTADPRRVPAARPIRWLTYEEAEELAQSGARVLHPRSIEPARRTRVPIVVRPLSGGRATTIGPANGHPAIRAITSRGPLRLMHLRVAGGGQRAGVAAQVTERLASAAVNLVSVFTTGSTLSVVVDPSAVSATFAALAPMSDGASVGRLERARPVALVTCIGRGVTGDVLRLDPRKVADAEGVVASPRSIAMVVPLSREPGIVRALHRALVERGRQGSRARPAGRRPTRF